MIMNGHVDMHAHVHSYCNHAQMHGSDACAGVMITESLCHDTQPSRGRVRRPASEMSGDPRINVLRHLTALKTNGHVAVSTYPVVC